MTHCTSKKSKPQRRETTCPKKTKHMLGRGWARICKSPTSTTCYTTALRDHFDALSLSSKEENYPSSEDFIDSQIRLCHPSPVAFHE